MILYITGTHGDEDGDSGLSDPEMLHHNFYLEDCEKVGVEPGPDPGDLEILMWILFFVIISIFLSSSFKTNYFALTLLIGICVPALYLQCGCVLGLISPMWTSHITNDRWHFTHPATRLDPPPPGSLYSKPELTKMDIRLANIAFYHNNRQEIIKHINDVSKSKDVSS